MKKIAKITSYLALGALYAAPAAGVDKTLCIACGVTVYGVLAALSC